MINDPDKTQRIRLTQDQVRAIAKRHEMLYAGKIGGARAVFSFMDLSNLDFSGLDLSDADFTGSVLVFEQRYHF